MFDEVTILCKHEYHNSTTFMFRDVQNLLIVPILDTIYETDAPSYIDSHRHLFSEVEVVGYHNMNHQLNLRFDQMFYHIANISYEKKYTDFYINRDLESENIFASRLGLPEKYIFIHDDPSRGYNILTDKIKSESYKVKISDIKDFTTNIFDYISVIERAEEIHCIDSCLLSLIDIMNLNPNIFYHRYSRFYDNFSPPNLIRNWKII